MSSNLIKLIEPAFVEDFKSYWAMHFCSILETLYEHKQLEYNIYKSIPCNSPITLSNFVGITERGFFSRMRESIRNWGLQYFLCHYLMSKEGSKVFYELLNQISDNYDYELSKHMESYGVFVCGIDSYSGEHFLKNTKANIFGYTTKTITNVWEDIKYVDLCILINYTFNGNFATTALLGEVEGNKGSILLGEKIWSGKSSLCLFGIGVKYGNRDTQIYNVKHGSSTKSVITIGSQFPVIDDFHSAIGVMEVFLSMNHQHKITRVVGQNEIIDIIRYHWNLPIQDLIGELRLLINKVDLASMGTNALSIHTVPKIII